MLESCKRWYLLSVLLLFAFSHPIVRNFPARFIWKTKVPSKVPSKVFTLFKAFEVLKFFEWPALEIQEKKSATSSRVLLSREPPLSHIRSSSSVPFPIISILIFCIIEWIPILLRESSWGGRIIRTIWRWVNHLHCQKVLMAIGTIEILIIIIHKKPVLHLTAMTHSPKGKRTIWRYGSRLYCPKVIEAVGTKNTASKTIPMKIMQLLTDDNLSNLI